MFPVKANYTSRQRNFTKWLKNTCEYIVLHHTATWFDTVNGNIRTLLWETWRQVSAHFLIDTNWEVYKLGDPTQVLWHAGTSSWEWRTDMNRFSIGIEVIGPLPNVWFTNEQKFAVRRLCEHLMKVLNIPKERVIRHKDIAPGRKTDISDTLWWDKYKTFEEYRSKFIARELTA